MSGTNDESSLDFIAQHTVLPGSVANSGRMCAAASKKRRWAVQEVAPSQSLSDPVSQPRIRQQAKSLPMTELQPSRLTEGANESMLHSKKQASQTGLGGATNTTPQVQHTGTAAWQLVAQQELNRGQRTSSHELWHQEVSGTSAAADSRFWSMPVLQSAPNPFELGIASDPPGISRAGGDDNSQFAEAELLRRRESRQRGLSDETSIIQSLTAEQGRLRLSKQQTFRKILELSQLHALQQENESRVRALMERVQEVLTTKPSPRDGTAIGSMADLIDDINTARVRISEILKICQVCDGEPFHTTMALRQLFGTRVKKNIAARACMAGMSDARNFATETISGVPCEVFNPEGEKRVIVTKELPGQRWLDILTKSGCRVEVSKHEDTILSNATIKKLLGDKCHGVLGQLTEDWGDELFAALKKAGGTAYSNYAVGYNNVDVNAATKNGIAVGNTPGVLTETTAELALALTFAAARRVVEGDKFMRANLYKGWLPTLFVGNLLQRKTVGIIGAGRIGAAYARMLSEGHKMNIVYYDPYPNKFLEEYIRDYSKLLESKGEPGVSITKLDTVEDVLKEADVVSLHCNLDKNTTHLMNKSRLSLMKEDAILINASRGPVIDEVALVEHLQANPNFRCGLDVFEDEPETKPGLKECDNAVIVPHIASASQWTRAGMATLAAANVAAHLQGFPVWTKPNVLDFVDGDFDKIPKAAPSIVNAKELGIQEFTG